MEKKREEKAKPIDVEEGGCFNSGLLIDWVWKGTLKSDFRNALSVIMFLNQGASQHSRNLHFT